MFTISIVPAARALYHTDDERFLNAPNPDEGEKELAPLPEATQPEGKPGFTILKAQKISVPVKAYEEELKLEEEIKNIKKEHDVKKYIEDVKASFNKGKAYVITEYALKISHRLQIQMEFMLKSMQNNEEFMKKHPDATARMEELLKELSKITTQLKAVLLDNELTREEWTKQVVPALKDLRRLIITLREKHQGFFNEWRHKHTQDTVAKVIEKLTEKRDKIKDHLLRKGFSEIEVMKRLQEIDEQIVKLREATGMEGPRPASAGPGMKAEMAPGQAMKAEKVDAIKIKKSLTDIKEALKGSEDKERDENNEEDVKGY